ncbi:hypothetical protein [Leyella stercorea]|uniref:hypothetical protein n=1 Tax=Leyella stercorea TaxID=363265 RepID=UPI0024306805|nr:hypothetical protein [Leyella stercorea]
MASLPYPSNHKPIGGYGILAIPFLHYLNIILTQIQNIRCNFAFKGTTSLISTTTFVILTT